MSSDGGKVDKCISTEQSRKIFTVQRFLQLKIHPSDHLGRFYLVVFVGMFLMVFGTYASIENANATYEKNVSPLYISDPTQAKILIRAESLIQTMLGIILLIVVAYRFALVLMLWTWLNVISMITTMIWHCVSWKPIGVTWELALAWFVVHLLEIATVQGYINAGIAKELQAKNYQDIEIEMV